MTSHFALKLLLRLIGGIELCAIPFLAFPFPWMAEIHARWLGLGTLPPAPIVEYLARSLCALYAVHGAVVFYISFDVIRYRPLIDFIGCVHIVLGFTILGIDLSSGVPIWWAVMGPAIAVGGVLMRVMNQESPAP